MSGPRKHERTVPGSFRFALTTLCNVWDPTQVENLVVRTRLERGESHTNLTVAQRDMLREKIKASRSALDVIEKKI